MKLLAIVTGLSFSLSLFANVELRSCEIAFARMMGERASSELTGTNRFNLWDKKFDIKNFIDDISKNTQKDRTGLLEDLSKLIGKDEVFNKNLSEFATEALKKNLIPYGDVKRILEVADHGPSKFFVSQATKEVKFKIDIPEGKIKAIDQYLDTQKHLTQNYRKEYRDILISSNRTEEELKAAIQSGMKLRPNAEGMEQFRYYIEFLDDAKPKRALSGMKEIEKIYDFKFNPNRLKPGMLEPVSTQYLNNRHKIARYEDKRYQEIMDEMRLMDNPKLVKEIEELEILKRKGRPYDEAKLKALKQDLHKQEMRDVLKKRARVQAHGEASVYRKLINGCNAGKSSKRLDAAKGKFKKFKIGLSLVSTPFFYYMKNKDKLETDDYWFERLGYEMGIGLIFTYVGNKIVTNTNSSFWQKYLQGQVTGALLDAPSAYGYDALFGKHSYIRYVKQIYGGELTESEMEKEFEKLKNSPTFEKDMKELFATLDERSKDRNVKNFLNDYFNLSAYDSSMDPDKITQEDLESEEAREMMIELLAERMYLNNMGDAPLFQTGNKGADRWAFYRTIGMGTAIKGLLLDLAIFRVLCTEPLGPVGSWGLALGIVLSDKYIMGDFTYQYRRDAINQ